MFTPEATAARTARLPECMNVPSPTFWKKCSRPVKGAIPIQWAPSPPIWVRPMTSPTCSGERKSTMAWQPIPPPTSAPSGTMAEVLWGQPEQKYGVRWGSGGPAASVAGRRRSRRARTEGMSWSARRRGPRAAAMTSGSSSPVDGKRSRPSSSWRPTTPGRSLVP